MLNWRRIPFGHDFHPPSHHTHEQFRSVAQIHPMHNGSTIHPMHSAHCINTWHQLLATNNWHQLLNKYLAPAGASENTEPSDFIRRHRLLHATQAAAAAAYCKPPPPPTASHRGHLARASLTNTTNTIARHSAHSMFRSKRTTRTDPTYIMPGSPEPISNAFDQRSCTQTLSRQYFWK